MDTTPIIAAIIGVIGGVITTLITVFRDDIRNLFSGKGGQHKSLVGRWQCKWFVDPGVGSIEVKNAKLLTSDAVNISELYKDRFSASGENPKYGNYKIDGRVSLANLVTLTWTGADERTENVGGVALLELNATWDEMNGYWYEYSRSGVREFYGGRTTWKRSS
jgi:hypothetical protein